MKILVLNSGSSSVKFQLLDMEKGVSEAQGLIEKIGEETGRAKLEFEVGGEEKKLVREEPIADHKVGLGIVNSMLAESGLMKSFDELDGVGHRVVHGGEKFSAPALVDDKVIDEIRKVSPLAPLHNPANLAGIEGVMAASPNLPNVVVFDTAFHQTMPKEAYMYAVPYELYKESHVRRYGFHGTSHMFVAREAAKVLGKKEEDVNVITLHLGNGCSAAAVKGGKSVDTSMGLTPLEGLMMGTRCGDIDPAAALFIAKEKGLDMAGLDKLMNKQSGLKGICGNNDMRAVEESAAKGEELFRLALDMYCYRVKKYIGAYAAAMGKLDAVVFTAGVGENGATIREQICANLKDALGIEMDTAKNAVRSKEARDVSVADSKVRVLVVPTNEELEIATQAVEVIKAAK